MGKLDEECLPVAKLPPESAVIPHLQRHTPQAQKQPSNIPFDHFQQNKTCQSGIFVFSLPPTTKTPPQIPLLSTFSTLLDRYDLTSLAIAGVSMLIILNLLYRREGRNLFWSFMYVVTALNVVARAFVLC